MIVVKTDTVYHAFGLKIKSIIPLPELVASNEAIDVPEVQINIAELNDIWEKKSSQQGKIIVENCLVMFQVPDTATFLIEDGKKIIVSPMKESDENKIRLYILGTCMGVLLMQRKVLALHGSAIAIGGKAYAFIGDSGAGKSTLASTFIKHGYQLLSDDIIPIIKDKKGLPNVIPTYPQQKLWLESLKKFGMNSAAYSPLFERETKFAIPVYSNYYDQPLQLAGVFEITKIGEGNVKIMPIENLKRFSTLFYQTFRHSLIPRLGLREWHFTESARIIKHIKMYQVQRPTVDFTAPELFEKILKIINEEMG